MTKTTKQDLTKIAAEMQARSAIEAPPPGDDANDLNSRLAQAWPHLRLRAAERWPALAGPDLENADGDYSRLLGLLETRLGLDASEAEQEILRLLDAPPTKDA